jgi:hypothetical protein
LFLVASLLWDEPSFEHLENGLRGSTFLTPLNPRGSR